MSSIYSTLVSSLDRKTILTAAAGAGLATALCGALGAKFFLQLATMVSERYKNPSAADDYCSKMSLRLTPEQKELREATEKVKYSIMISSAEEAQLLANLIRSIRGKKVIEVGVFTGYGTLTMALALPPEGTVVACDISDEWPNIGRPFWHKAGVEDKIDLRIAKATETLQKLIDQGQSGTYDFAFIDADKENYENYYELCLKLIRPGGIIAVDNVFLFGSAYKPENAPARLKEMGAGVRKLNEKIRDDPRVEVSMLNISDGLTLAFKN